MTTYEIATLASSIAIGLGQIGIVWYAIRAMTRTTTDRANEHDKRHTEAMTALRELIARTGQSHNPAT